MIKKIIIFTLTSFFLLSCDKKPEQNQRQSYDYSDEKNQDFYSIQSRKLYKEFNKNGRKNINTSWDWHLSYKNVIKYTQQFDIENPHAYPGGSLEVRRIAPENDTIHRHSNHFIKKEDILNYYKNHPTFDFTVEPCDEREEVPNLICLNINKSGPHYFYFPHTSKKYPFIGQSIDFYCDAGSKPVTKRSCTLFNHPDQPFNIGIGIEFTNPNDFFYIIPYVENLLFNATGEHIWQTSHKQKETK